MDWTAIPRSEWISLTALLIACASASFTWRNLRISARKERREIDATKPVVEHYINFGEDLPPEFLGIRLIIRNRAGHSLMFDAVKAIDPREFGIYDWRLLPDAERSLGGDPSEAGMRAAVRPELRFDEPIDPGDRCRADILLAIHRPVAEIRLQLSLSERLPEIRRSAITVKITLPAETIKAATERSRVRPSVVASTSESS